MRRIVGSKPARPCLYEVWIAYWPRKYKNTGERQTHYVLVMQDGAGDVFRCLMINSPRSNDPAGLPTLSKEQAKAAGVKEGVFRMDNSHLIPLDCFEKKTGSLLREEALDFETRVCRPRSAPSGPSGPGKSNP